MDGDDGDFDADLQRALELSRESAPPPPPPPPQATPADVVVLGQIPAKFRVYAATAAGRPELDVTGKILLPQSCLQVFVQFLGEMPPTLLLRLVGGEGSKCIVGVAEFIDDEQAAALLAVAAGPRAREMPLPRLYDRGPLAACFVPRWARGALIVDPMCPEAFLQIVTLPLATHMVLRPHRDDFAAALAASGDVRETLTDLMNRFPAVATGAAPLALRLDGLSHLVDVLAIKGRRDIRCGAPTASTPAEGAVESVPAACLVDADVEVDFAPSVEHEAKAHAVQAQAHAALEQARAAEAAQRHLVEEASNPWSATNVGMGHALGGGGSAEAAPAVAASVPVVSEREKRLAALAKRGL